MAVATQQRGASRRDLLLSQIFQSEPNLFLQSGPVAERALSRARGGVPFGDPAERGLSFTVAEARDRLVELISGALSIRSITELAQYLKDNFLTLEVRFFGGNQPPATYVRDQISGGVAPAKAIHPALSAERVSKLPDGPTGASPRGPDLEMARLRDTLATALGGRAPDYSFGTARLGLPSALSRTEQRILVGLDDERVNYTGRPVLGEASVSGTRAPFQFGADPSKARAELYAVLAAAAAAVGREAPPLEAFKRLTEERQVEVLSKRFIFDKGQGPYSQVIWRDASAKRADEIHPGLGYEAMRARSGLTYAETGHQLFREMREQRAARSDNVADFPMDRVRRGSPTLAVVEGPEPPVAQLGNGFGGIEQSRPEPVSRAGIVIISDETSLNPRICRYSHDGSHREMPQFHSLHDLPAGEYRHLVLGATYDAPSGYVVVGQDRGVTFQDVRKQEHNLDGPSHVPDPSNRDDFPRYAVDGKKLDRASWEAQFTRAPDGSEGPEYGGGGFGYGAPSIH